MIDPELVAKIRLLFFAEHWKIGTIATQLNLHRDTVRAALETDRFNRSKQDRISCKTDPYVDFIRQTLAQYPRLRSTRILPMIRARGYEGGSSQLRRLVARLRPVVREPFLQLRTFPGEQGQADWADFGEVRIGQARRRLSLLCHYPFWRGRWLCPRLSGRGYLTVFSALGSGKHCDKQDSLCAGHGVKRRGGSRDRLPTPRDFSSGNYRRQCSHAALCSLVGAPDSGTFWHD
jgi:hypothetical protein